MELLTTTAVWAEFDPGKEIVSDIVSSGTESTVYSLKIDSVSDGDVIIDVRIYKPDFDSRKTILLIKEYGREAQNSLVSDLVKRGYNVVIPDFDGAYQGTVTIYPESLNYCVFDKTGTHLTEIIENARDTCQYNYSVAIRRTITFINSVLPQSDIVLMGIRGGADVAVQVAATDSRIIGLICICGACYTEYLNLPKYGEGAADADMSDDRIRYITTASSLAYAKHVTCPSIFALGTNGTQSDVDRLSNLVSIMANAKVRILLSKGSIDNIDFQTYSALISHLETVFICSAPVASPVLTLEVNKEGAIYANVKTDSPIDANNVKIFYSIGDNNHITRYFRAVGAENIGINEFIARIRFEGTSGLLFAYCEVEYINGTKLCSTVNCIDLVRQGIKATNAAVNPIVYQCGFAGEFIEVSKDDAVIMTDYVETKVFPPTLKGSRSDGEVVLYFPQRNVADDRLLRVDTLSTEPVDGWYTLSLTAVHCANGKMQEFTCLKNIEASGGFDDTCLTYADFKDEKYLPMPSWTGIRMLKINDRTLVIGKIMFV